MDDAASTLELRPQVAPHRATPATQSAPSQAKLLLRGATWLALVASIVCGLHAAIQAGLRRITTADFGVTNRIVNGQINADIVITGSSRAMVHYDPRVIETTTRRSAFNLGRNGSQTDMQLAVLKTYLRHNAKPRLVIHNLDLYSFVTSHEIYDPAQYLPYLDEQPIYAGVRRVYPEAWKWKFVPVYGYVVADTRFTWIAGLKRLVGVEPREDHFAGFVPRAWTWTDDFENFRRANPHGIRTPVEAQGIRDVEDLLALCRDSQIPVLLVYSPEYFEVQALETNRSAIFAKFAELSARFGAPLWDFSDSAISRDRTLFYNSQHLNAQGAAAFSQELARRLDAARF